MPRKAKTEAAGLAPQATSKLDRLVAMLQQETGADMPAMIDATGWQAHSIRGAMAGALKKRGHIVSSGKDGERRVWRIAALTEPAQ